MTENAEIVRGKIKWQSDDGEIGLIKDQMGRKIYFTQESIMTTPGAKKPQLSQGESVEVMIKGGRRVNQDILQADKIVSFGVELDDEDDDD